MAETDLKRVWRLMKSISFCMLSNWDGKRLHSRPMGAFVRQEEGAIYFFTDDRTRQGDEIRHYPNVCIAFADVRRQKYVSISGTAEISCDQVKIEELWAIPAKVWWGTPSNPHIRLIRVRPENLEYWDAPGNFISSLGVALALLKGTHPSLGEHKKIAL